MKNLECSEIFFDTKVNYYFKPANQDRRHLIVVFSGFATDYDFFGTTSQGCRSNILWIKDDFKGRNSYYLCENFQFNIEKAVISLIEKTKKNLSLNNSQCTLLGFSKGGSAALYYGLKYGFKNIISSCPQLLIGSYVRDNWVKAANFMIGSDSISERINSLDKLIPELLNSDNITDSNIYLITSPDDTQYKNQIEPFLPMFWGSQNFNLIYTSSQLAWQHSRVSRYNIPIILSILYAHAEGIIPKFGTVKNGSVTYPLIDQSLVLNEIRERNSAVAFLDSISFSDGLFYPHGLAFIKGYECPTYSSISQKLIIYNATMEYEFPLGKNLTKDVSYEFFEQVYIDYSAGLVSSFKNEGVDIRELPLGSYRLKAKITNSITACAVDFSSRKEINVTESYGGRIYTFRSLAGGIILEVSESVNYESMVKFEIFNCEIKNKRLFISGSFIVKGLSQSSWGDSNFFVVITNGTSNYTFKLGKQKDKNPNLAPFLNQYLYTTSSFSSLKNEGVDISELKDDNYELHISLVKNGVIFSQKTMRKLIVKDDNMYLN